ncbi:hypothetical protein MKW98_001928, partial [Papaver atlanticum]
RVIEQETLIHIPPPVPPRKEMLLKLSFCCYWGCHRFEKNEKSVRIEDIVRNWFDVVDYGDRGD